MNNRPRFNDRGAGFTEYGLLLALIAAVVFVSVVALGDNTSGLFDTASVQLQP